MMNRISIFTLVFAAAACGGSGSGANSADDADSAEGAEGGELAKPAPRTLEEGARVCLEGVAGQRYPIEDAIEQFNLELANSCISADVMVDEVEEEGAYTLRYQMIGSGEWKECESAGADRVAFLETCIDTMITEIGSGAAVGGADEESDEEEAEEE